MAIVQLKDVTVTFVNGRGGGFKVEEVSESRGKTYKTKYSVWPATETGVKVGDVISLSGFLSAKMSDPWTDRDGNERVSVELSVNSPRIANTPARQEQTPEPESWATPDYADETPF